MSSPPTRVIVIEDQSIVSDTASRKYTFHGIKAAFLHCNVATFLMQNLGSTVQVVLLVAGQLGRSMCEEFLEYSDTRKPSACDRVVRSGHARQIDIAPVSVAESCENRARFTQQLRSALFLSFKIVHPELLYRMRRR
jgi:hypothetical protein